MELWPVRVAAPAGARTTFTCSYRASFPGIYIHMSALPAPTVRRGAGRTGLDEGMAQYRWGATRQWTLVVESHHRAVQCRLATTRGRTVGLMYATVSPGPTCHCYNMPATTNITYFIALIHFHIALYTVS